MIDETAIIIQARLESTRLRGKILKKIYFNDTILDLILKNLKRLKQKIIIATSTNHADDVIVENAMKNDVDFFRGDENNVLKRYIDCANEYRISKIIRITSDNVFVQPILIEPLINNNLSNIDYITYKIDNTNVVLTHWGLFGEFVTIDALEKVANLSKEQNDIEHVTHYIYHHPDEFNIKFWDVPEDLRRRDIRLTVDTQADFDICQKIIFYLKENKLKWHYSNIVNYIENHPEIKERMKLSIENARKSSITFEKG
ncbi:MAG: cytidylyltransferase domain-containing protein [Candidatus Thorarchaeota archaeon]